MSCFMGCRLYVSDILLVVYGTLGLLHTCYNIRKIRKSN